MSIGGDMRERHGRVLGELAEAGMAIVRRLSAAMLATDDLQTQAQVGLAFHRVSRAVRQTIALEFRLTQEPRRAEPAPRSPRTAEAPTAPSRPPPERTGWSEHERDDSDEPDEALDALDLLLDADELDVEAVREAVEASMASICRDFAADSLLVKAGLLDADAALDAARPRVPAAGPVVQGRRSGLLTSGAFASPDLEIFSRSAKDLTVRRSSG